MEHDEFKKFMSESFEFYSRIRAAEKERFEVMQKFMVQSAEVLEEISETLKKTLKNIENKMDEFQLTISKGIDSIKNMLGTEKLEKINLNLQDILDKIQRQSYIIEYREAIKSLKSIINNMADSQPEPKKSPTNEQIKPIQSKTQKYKTTIRSTPKNPQIKPKINVVNETPENLENLDELENIEELPTFLRVEKKKPINYMRTQPEKQPKQIKHAVQLKPVPTKNEDNK
ncbi:MAG: hypothetical protein ACTSYZ_13185 [Candidatus Helarchaeota archaeon]